jgi:hypothetical protein
MLCCPRCKDEPFPRIRIILDIEVIGVSVTSNGMGMEGLVRDWECKFRCDKCGLVALERFFITGKRTLKRARHLINNLIEQRAI